MTAPAITRPPTEADIRAAIVGYLDHDFCDMRGRVREGIAMAADVVDYGAFYVLDSERAEDMADEPDPHQPTIWWDLRPTEALRLREVVHAAKERLEARCEALILEELTAAGVAFAAEFPEAPRP